MNYVATVVSRMSGSNDAVYADISGTQLHGVEKTLSGHHLLTSHTLSAGAPMHATSVMRSARSDPDFRHVHAMPREQAHSQLTVARDHPRLRSASEANLLQSAMRTNRRHSIAPIDPGYIAHGEMNFKFTIVKCI